MLVPPAAPLIGRGVCPYPQQRVHNGGLGYRDLCMISFMISYQSYEIIYDIKHDIIYDNIISSYRSDIRHDIIYDIMDCLVTFSYMSSMISYKIYDIVFHL
jgi:hypothetical protein